MALLQDTDPHPVANVPAGTGESSVLIRTLSHTLYALLATLTTGRSLRLVQRVPNKNGFEVWRQLGAENAPKTVGRRFAMLHDVLQPGMGDNPSKFEDAWKTWEHQVDVYDELATSKLDDDDNLLVNSQHFESNCNKLRAIIQAYMNWNKSWIADDFRNDTKKSDPMEVDHIDKGNGKGKCKNKGNGAKSDQQNKECYVWGQKGHFARNCWSRANQGAQQ